MDIKPGEKYRLFYDKGNPNNELVHIRAIVDEEYVVVRYWLRRKRRWCYRVENMLWFRVSARHLTKVS